MEEEIKMKEIIYKGKKKLIPEQNTPGLCEYFIIAKMRYCRFNKLENYSYCVYHSCDEDRFLPCPHDPTHKVLKEHYKKHVNVCNKFTEKKILELNPWYSKDINRINKFDNQEEIKRYYELK
jgi:tRNA:m4X modification enzyme